MIRENEDCLGSGGAGLYHQDISLYPGESRCLLVTVGNLVLTPCSEEAAVRSFSSSCGSSSRIGTGEESRQHVQHPEQGRYYVDSLDSDDDDSDRVAAA